MKKYYKEILEEAEKIKDEMIEIRRGLHENPGTGFDIEYSLSVVEEKLREYGYEYKRVGKAGISAMCGTDESKVFLLRGDMDGLPIVEETDLDFKSNNNKMHACGHDMHTTMLLGAAKILKKYENELEGLIKFMFQPAEEIMEGAKDMVEAGILENPKVHAASMIHVMPGFPIDNGTMIIAQEGQALSSCDWWEVIVHGKSGHGSMPNNAIDPMPALAAIHNAFSTLLSREIAADESIALTAGEMHSGSTSNVIADTGELKGTLRTFNLETRANLKIRMKDMSENIAKAYRCTAEVKFLSNAPTLIVDKELRELAKVEIPKYISKVINYEDLGVPRQMGSEDFAYVSHEVPSIAMFLANADSRISPPYPVHHPLVVFDEEVMVQGIAAHIGIALSWLGQQK